MMDKNTANVALATILTTAADIGEPAPETPFYLALQEKLGIDIHDWQLLTTLLVRGGLATISNHLVTLTPKGLTMAAMIDAKVSGRGGTEGLRRRSGRRR